VPRWPAVQHLSLTVRDLDRSRAFYRDFLGFDDLGGDGVAELRVGGTKLVLLPSQNVAPATGVHFGFQEPSRDAVDEWGRKARARELTVDFGPAVAEWGGYVLYFRDPDGYRIEIWSDAGALAPIGD
jgi:catechol 2,3-dioxygenase-like lactoylglutathione lyase family enzyme